MNETSYICPKYKAPSSVFSGRVMLYNVFLVFFSLLLSQSLSAGTVFLHHTEISNNTVASEKDQPDTTVNDVNLKLSHIVSGIDAAWKNDRKTEAEALSEKGFSIVRKEQVHDSVYADLLHVYGKMLVDQQLNQGGIDSLQKSIRLIKNVFGEDHLNLAKTYNYIGIGYFHLSDFENAIKYYQLSADILVRNNIWNPSLFDAYLNIGIVSAVSVRYDKAYEYFELAHDVIDSIGSDVDSLIIARFYLNYGLLATLNGKLEEGNNHFNISEPIYLKKRGPGDPSMAGIYINKGLNEYYNYDFEKALLYYKKALDIYKINDRYKEGKAISYINLSTVSLKAGKNEQAISYAKKGLLYSPADELKWKVYSNIAQAYMALDSEDSTEIYFNKAITLEKNGKVSMATKINLLIAYADYRLKKENFVESKKYYEEARELIESSYGKFSAPYARLLSRLGFYYLSVQELDSALDYFNRSVHTWSGARDSSGVKLETFNEVQMSEAYIGRAEAYYDKFKKTGEVHYLSSARSDIRMILDKMEIMSGNLDKESRLLLTDQLKPAYNLALSIEMQLYQIKGEDRFLEEAFTCSEKSKSAVLLSSVRNLSALKSTDVPPEIMVKEIEITEEINGTRQLLIDERKKAELSQKKIAFFENHLLQLIVEHDSLIVQLEQNYPRYFALKYDRSTITIDSLQKQLKEDEVLIEYTLTDSVVYIFSVSQRHTAIMKVELDTLFWRSMDYMLNLKNVDISMLRTSEFERFYLHSNRLWKALIEPVDQQIKAKRLIFIPDGMLGYLPFEILAANSEEGSNIDFRSMPYLIKEFPVSYSYSATLKYNPYFKKESHSNDELIAFAPEYERTTENDSLTRDFHLANLPYAEQEAMRIKDMWGGTVLSKEIATKSNFLKKAEKFNVLHLAMHTLINDTLPMYSKLVFTRPGSDTATNMLNTFEVYDLDLNASMVTLSACNTGTGMLRTGEGIMSLARGFIYAGVPSIVMTLWEVQDKSGSELMIEYYRNLLDGDPKDVALQKAKLKMLDASPTAKTHPFYWSAYIITGDTQPLVNKIEIETWYVLPAVALIILLVVLFLKEKKKRKH